MKQFIAKITEFKTPNSVGRPKILGKGHWRAARRTNAKYNMKLFLLYIVIYLAVSYIQYEGIILLPGFAGLRRLFHHWQPEHSENTKITKWKKLLQIIKKELAFWKRICYIRCKPKKGLFCIAFFRGFPAKAGRTYKLGTVQKLRLKKFFKNMKFFVAKLKLLCYAISVIICK